MKKYLFPVLITFVASGLFWIGVYTIVKSNSKPCKHSGKKYVNAINDGRFVVVPKDCTDGRPTFTVIFEDDSTMDYLYAAEIAHGLATGEWKYNDFLEEHVCVDPTKHKSCDGRCECDGLECSKGV